MDEFKEAADELLARGFVEIPEFRKLKVGGRIRGQGQRWYEAVVHGTATVERIFHKPDSSWSQKYGRPDVELIARRDSGDIMLVADYHVTTADGE
jgi:hypothetical protein